MPIFYMLCLCISGFDADPDEVTKILEIQPSSIGRIGDIKKSGTPRGFNGWWLETYKDSLVDGVQHHNALERIIDQIDSKEDKFEKLRCVLNPRQISIYGGLYKNYDQQCGIWLTPSQMLILAKCGIEWGLDIYDGEMNNDTHN